MFELFTLAYATVLGFITDSFVVAASTSQLADQVRNFVGPLVMIACGIAALAFLWQRQFTQMIIFLVIAIAVFAIFYVPDFLVNIGKSAGNANKNLTWN